MAAPISGVGCPNCRQINPVDTFFCMNCGTPLRAQPLPVQPPRKRRRGCLIWASLLLVLVFLCSLSYWTTLIRVPILPRTAAVPAAVIEAARVVNVVQDNLNPPQGVVDFVDMVVYKKNETILEELVFVKPGRNPNPRRIAGGPNDGTVEVPPPGFTPPPVCGPELELTVSNVREIQPWGGGFAGLWGNGPTLYEIQNDGESLKTSEYEYRAWWVIWQQGDGNYISENTCSISGDTLLICSGPDRSNYDKAELTILSENPNCPIPVGSFTFEGNSVMPVDEEKTEVCSPLGSFSLAGFFHSALTPLDYKNWGFDIHLENKTPEEINYQYYLVAETIDSDGGGGTWRSYCEMNIIYNQLSCFGPDQEKFTSISYALYQHPEDVCTDPVAFGNLGSVTVAGEPEPQSCIPEVVQQIDDYLPLVMRTRDDYNSTFDNPYAIRLPDLPGLDLDQLELYAEFDVFDSQGRQMTTNARYDCLARSMYAIPCNGPTVSDDQSVTMRVYYANDGCNELLSERTWPATVAAIPTITATPYDRCKAFSSINIKPIVMNWILGSPVNLYFEMPGGVPGLEREILGDNDPWVYTVQIADKSSTDCEFIPDYKERLYCSVSLPDYYSNTVNPLTLTVNGCNQPLSTLTTYLILDKSGGGAGCPAGQTYHPPNSVWPGGCCSNGHWYIWGNDKEPGCWN